MEAKMGRMKDRFMDIVDYAEDCCGAALTKQEAESLFYALYPQEHEIFEDAWERFLMFLDEIMTNTYEGLI